MSDENTPDGESPDGQDNDHSYEAWAAERKQLIAQRQAEKEKRRQYEAQVAEYEAKEKEARQAALREAENFAELEKEIRAEVERERAEKESALSEIANVHKSYRQEKLLTVLTEKSGRGRYVLEGLLANAEREGLDVAPEQVDDKSVDALLRHFKKQAPELFAVESRGGSPGTPGLNTRTKPPGERPFQSEEDKYRDMGKRYSMRYKTPTAMPGDG